MRMHSPRRLTSRPEHDDDTDAACAPQRAKPAERAVAERRRVGERGVAHATACCRRDWRLCGECHLEHPPLAVEVHGGMLARAHPEYERIARQLLTFTAEETFRDWRVGRAGLSLIGKI